MSKQLDYVASGSIDDQLNRVFAVADGSTNFAEYSYLDGGSIVQVDDTQTSFMMDRGGGTTAELRQIPITITARCLADDVFN